MQNVVLEFFVDLGII